MTQVLRVVARIAHAAASSRRRLSCRDVGRRHDLVSGVFLLCIFDPGSEGLLAHRAQESRANAARLQLRKKIAQQQRLLKQLQGDLESHANADAHKRIGDLLLANLSTGKRKGNRVALIDYFSDDASPIEIELDHAVSLQEEAQRRFALYQRSKRAVGQVTSRINAVKKELQELKAKEETLEQALAEPPPVRGPREGIASGVQDAGRLSSSSKPILASRRAEPKRITGTRRYISADGFEVLVGRTSKDNDHLTLKVAKPNDLWLHAADYGGSHVVVRNSTRKEVPHRTLIEAAQLAAWFSQAKKDPKVDVHYTERKFVSKPKGAKPGLVRLQRFKNITVEPKEAGTRA